MVLVVAALYEEVEALLGALHRSARRIVHEMPCAAYFSHDVHNPTHTQPMFALFEIRAHDEVVRVGVLVTGVGKVASASAVSTLCALHIPHALVCVSCALGLDVASHACERYTLACVATAVQHDVNCTALPRMRVQQGTKKAYKKCTYGEFVHESTKRHAHLGLLAITREHARRCAHFHNVGFCEHAAMLSGDVFVSHAKPARIPQSVRVASAVLAQCHTTVLLDMETAAVFYAASRFNVPSVACAVVLDSFADSRPLSFSSAIGKVSHMLSDLVLRIAQNLNCKNIKALSP